ncbi:hypothetical protein E4T47_04539 [Aureobasidium subglaciale]|nr:hypothetical protein E4T47_04539 [Aureobasidium subglaciale]
MHARLTQTFCHSFDMRSVRCCRFRKRSYNESRVKVPATSVAATRNLVVPSCPSINISKVSHALCFRKPRSSTSSSSSFEKRDGQRFDDDSNFFWLQATDSRPKGVRRAIHQASSHANTCGRHASGCGSPNLNPPCPATQAAQKIQPAMNNIILLPVRHTLL